MRYRRSLTVLAAFTVGVALLLAVLPTHRALVVRGRPVSEWALALCGPAPTGPAQEVFRSLGAEAVPDLVRMLRTRDSIFKRPIHALTVRMPERLAAPTRRFFRLNAAPRRREAATMALGLMGTNATAAVPALLDALRDPELPVSLRAAVDLGRIGPASLPGLMAALDDPVPSARRAGMAGLAELGAGAGPTVPKLIRLLEDPIDRVHARSALQAIGKPAVAGLVKALRPPAPEMRIEAAMILGQIGVPARAAVPVLIELAADSAPSVRASAINALGMICNWCAPVVSVLQQALEDESSDVRRLAATHLRANPPAAQQTVDWLLAHLEQGRAEQWQRAVTKLRLMGAAAERTVPALRKFAEESTGRDRELALEAVRQIETFPGGREAVEP